MDAPASQVNRNSSWVDNKGNISRFDTLGAWATHLLVFFLLKIFFSLIPGVSREVSWSLANLTYNVFSFIMFHWITGVPFELNQGEYEGLTLWEQIDGGDQFTRTRKFLLALPILFFLISTHFSYYDLPKFTVNIVACLINVVAKLPQMHKVRIFGINRKYPD